MNRKIFIIASTLFLFVLVTEPAQAAGGTSDRLPAGETHHGNLYAAGETVEVVGKVESDVYAVGGTVVISGEVQGDVLVLGGRVRITGPVVGSVRVLGGEVELTSSVGRNVSVAAGKVLLAPGSYVFGHVSLAAGEIDLRGAVEGEVKAVAGQALLGGTVRGPVELWLDRGGSLRVLESAVLGSSVRYHSAGSAQIASGAKLAQPAQHLPLVVRSHESWRGRWFGELAWLFGLAVLAMVITYLIPKKLQEVAEEALTKPWPSLGWGAIWLIAVPIIAFLLLLTIIGIPLAVVLVALYIIGLFSAQVAAGAAIGWYARSLPALKFARNWKLLPVVLMGLLLYRIVAAVPFLGSLISLVVVLWCCGALLRVQRRTIASFS